MNRMLRTTRIGSAACSALIPLSLVLSSTYTTADDFTVLHRLGQKQRQEYVLLRDVLLRSHVEPWSVARACLFSWQAGLAAYILNARMKAPERFAQWEKAVEIGIGAAHMPYTAKGLNKVNRATTEGNAFLLEYGWKPPEYLRDYEPSLYEGARPTALGYVTLAPNSSDEARVLLRTLWDESTILSLRAAAIRCLASSSRDEDKTTVLEVLFDSQSPYEVRRAALTGYIGSNPPRLVETLIRLVNDPRAPEELASSAIRALGGSTLRKINDPRAQTVLRQIAADPRRPEALRCVALLACRENPHPEDFEIFQAALTQSDLPELQRTAARVVMDKRDERYLPALRSALFAHTTPDQVSIFAVALLKLGGDAELELIQSFIDHPDVPKDASERARGQLYRYEENKRIDAEKERLRQ